MSSFSGQFTSETNNNQSVTLHYTSTDGQVEITKCEGVDWATLTMSERADFQAQAEQVAASV